MSQNQVEAQVFANMLGVSMVAVFRGTDKYGRDKLVFVAERGRQFTFVAEPECCSQMWLEDVCGDLDDLVGSPLVEAELVSYVGPEPAEHDGSYTWSFYKFRTAKGAVTARWCGSSNGYYSETVTYREG